MMTRMLVEGGEPSTGGKEIDDVSPVEKELLNFINAFIHVDIIVHVPLVVGVLVDGRGRFKRENLNKDQLLLSNTLRVKCLYMHTLMEFGGLLMSATAL